jgi:hypothetical protein
MREKPGPLPETEGEFRFDGETVTIVKSIAAKKTSRGVRIVAHLKGKGDVPMTTDEIMALTRGD